MITFSIITITYNAAQHLSRTTESVMRQTYPNIEHIIIDGASTDNTLTLAKEYMERSYTAMNGHEVRIVCEPDNGLYDAMNKGLRLATGDYVCFLNAGDCFHEDDTLQQMVHRLHEAGLHELPDVIYGETQLVDSEGHFVRMRRLQT